MGMPDNHWPFVAFEPHIPGLKKNIEYSFLKTSYNFIHNSNASVTRQDEEL